jgi:hypothetical protein
MSEGIETCKDKVGLLLSEYVTLRDSDKLLWLAYLCKYHNLRNALGESGYQKLKAVIMDDKTPTMESIRRVRQKYQEGGMYAGTGRKKRLEEETVVREMMR